MTTPPGLHDPSIVRRPAAVAIGAAPRSCSGNSSLMDNYPRRSTRSTRRRTGSGRGANSRAYFVDKMSSGLRRKLWVLNPLLLLDLALPILHPACRARIMWDLVMLVVVLYVAVVAPLKISFSQATQLLSLHVLEFVITACLSLDIVANFRTAYISPRGELIRDSKLIATRYIRSMFLLDVAAAVPFGVILTSDYRFTSWLALLKLIPLVRLIRLMKGNGNVGSSLAMTRLLIFMLLVAHWACCFWHYLSEAIPEWPWMFTVRCPNCEPSLHYLLGYYSAFLLLLGDRPETHNNVERAVVTGLLFMGTLLYAIVMGSMALLVANMWAMASRHKQRATQVDDALRYRGVSGEVRGQVGEYFAHLADYQHPGSDGVAYLQELPVGLYNTVMGDMFGPMLAKVQLFAYCERPFLWRLAQRLRLSLFMSGDTIYDAGSVGHDMFIIWKGAVALVGQDSSMTAMMTDGDHFGELGLMTASVPRPHCAVALRPSDVMLLSRWDLQNAMKDFPESANLVKYRARSRLEDHEAPANDLWAFVGGWDQLLELDAAAGTEGPDWAGDGGGGFPGGGGGGDRRSLEVLPLQSHAVLKRQQQRQAAAQRLQSPPPSPQHGQQQLQCRFVEPGGRTDGCGSVGDGDGCQRTRGSGPVAEAREAAPRAVVKGNRARAAAAASAPAQQGRVRGAFSGFGARVAGLLSGRGPASSAAAAVAVTAQAECSVQEEQDEEDAISALAASSGLSLRAPSSAVLQVLAREGQAMTATQRRSLTSPAPPGRLSSSVEVTQLWLQHLQHHQHQQHQHRHQHQHQHHQHHQQHQHQHQQHQQLDAAALLGAGLSTTKAWRSQDGGWPSGVRRRSSVERTPPRVMGGVTAAITNGGGGRQQLHPQTRARKGSGLWLEEVSDGCGEIEDEEADGGGAWRPLGRRSVEYEREPVEHGAAAHQQGRSALGRLRSGRQSIGSILGRLGAVQHHHHNPLSPGTAAPRRAATGLPVSGGTGSGGMGSGGTGSGGTGFGRTGSRRRGSRGTGSGEQHPHHVQGLGAGSPALPPGLPGDLPSLLTLEEVWKQIQSAAGAGGQALGGTGGDPHQRLSLQRTASPSFQDQLPRLATSPTHAAQSPPPIPPHSLLQRQAYRGRPSFQTAAATAAATVSYGTLLMSHGSGGSGGAAAGQGQPVLASRGSIGGIGGGAGCFRQGSLPRVHSRASELTADALEALAPTPLQPLTTRSSLGAFSITYAQGLLSPMLRSPKTTVNGILSPQPPQPPSGRVTGRGLAEMSAGAASASPHGPRALVRGLSYGKARYGSCNARTVRSSTEYATAAPSGDRPTGDGGDGGDGDDSGWSSDSSREEHRRLVATLRAQLGQANARVLTLESQLADVNRDPLKVPAVAAVVQREVKAALTRVGHAVDARLAGVSDLLLVMSARTEDLSQVIAATDERVQRLEHELDGSGGFQGFSPLPGSSLALGAGTIAAVPSGGSGKLLGPAAGGPLGLMSLDAMPLARRSERRRSCNGTFAGGGAGLPQLSGRAVEAPRLAAHLAEADSSSVSDWRRSLTGGLSAAGSGGGGGGGGGGGTPNGGRRATSTRVAAQLQGPLQSILKNGSVNQNGAKMSSSWKGSAPA